MNKIRYSIHADPERIPVIHSNFYPPVTVTQENPAYAGLLMADLASAASEMTTVHQYLFQSWTIGGQAQTVRRVIQRMVAVEQHHFDIVGQLIALLGGVPECRAKTAYWCGNMVNYTRDLRELLSENAKAEEFAAKTYTSQSREIQDPAVSRVLARLAQDEALHHQIFSDFLAQL